MCYGSLPPALTLISLYLDSGSSFILWTRGVGGFKAGEKNFFERFVAFQEEIKFFLIRRQKKKSGLTFPIWIQESFFPLNLNRFDRLKKLLRRRCRRRRRRRRRLRCCRLRRRRRLISNPSKLFLPLRLRNLIWSKVKIYSAWFPLAQSFRIWANTAPWSLLVTGTMFQQIRSLHRWPLIHNFEIGCLRTTLRFVVIFITLSRLIRYQDRVSKMTRLHPIPHSCSCLTD